jgi:hypothetical protein
MVCEAARLSTRQQTLTSYSVSYKGAVTVRLCGVRKWAVGGWPAEAVGAVAARGPAAARSCSYGRAH